MSFTEAFKSIWLKPRDTVSELLQSNSSLYIILVLLAGVSLRLDQAANNNLGDRTGFSYILFSALVIGPIIGLLAWFFYSGMAHITARWLGGHGSWKETRTGIAWCSIPLLLKLILWIPQLFLFGGEMFTSATPVLDSSMTLLGLFFLFAILEVIINVWNLYILSQVLSELHGFSAWKGFISIIVIPLILAVVLVSVAIIA
ncbi:hypothetical protein GCM10011571_24430 [Marinithermofilum abyssi]|uniref:Yip1 domain-containing protein n=1 Tax=Marinithermofilum abyssi TaxID=1571185 RepID=A0A8J2YD31_9BACL|nr:Yip1 family protein [Marinithermofilum abyssi]GGE21453.1 hypothetical protein GCM10011571_24430 [Marinithermofilum abyssi]